MKIIGRVPSLPWPTPEHRSLAQVARTTELRTLSRKLSGEELAELIKLSVKAEKFNPPHDEKAGVGMSRLAPPLLAALFLLAIAVIGSL